MKEILQIKHFKHSFINASVVCAVIHTSASFHVENAVKDLQMLEAEDPEAEYQEQPEEEYEVVDPVADQDPTLTNFETQQGKPRCISTIIIASLLYHYLCIISVHVH